MSAPDTLLRLPLLGTPWAALLVASAMVAVPVLLHLWRRREVRTVSWAALRFLRDAAERTERRARWEERVLLATRIALALAVVFAVALIQPWAAELTPRLASSRPTGRTHVILVLDGSLSMTARASGESPFERAKREVFTQVVRQARPGDGFSLIVLGTPHQGPWALPTEDPLAIEEQLTALEPTHGAADLPRALVEVKQLLDQSPVKYRGREVYFLTDLHPANWQAGPGQQADLAAAVARLSRVAGAKRATFRLVDLGFDRPFNLRVTQLVADAATVFPEDDIVFRAAVRRDGIDSPDRVTASLWIGPADPAASGPVALRRVEQREVRFTAGDAAVEFHHRFPAVGEYAVQVRIDGQDGLEADDLRSLVLTVRADVPVLVVDGRAAGGADSQASYYLRHALANPRRRVRLRTVTPQVLASQIPGSPGSLESSACVFFSDIPTLGPREIERLEQHTRRGGGVVFFLGDPTSARWCNEQLYRQGKGLLPVAMGATAASEPAAEPFRFHVPADRPHSLLREFQGQGDTLAGLLTARFRRYHRVKPAAGTEVVLSFVSDGAERLNGTADPAVVASRFGDGRVIVVSTGAGLEGGSWPLNPSFVPVVQEMLVHAIRGRTGGRESVVGRPIEAMLPETGTVPIMITPSGDQEPLPRGAGADARAVFFEATGQGGIYRLGTGPVFAVNVDAGQSPYPGEPRRLTEAELRGSLPEWSFAFYTSCPRPLLRHDDPTPGGLDWLRENGAHLCLVFALFLILLESILSWRVARSRPPIGDSSDPIGPRWARIMLGAWIVVTALGIVLLATVIGLYLWSGDLFGFLPSAWRRGVETSLGIGGQATGEGREWRVKSGTELPGWVWAVAAGVIGAAVLAGYFLARGPFSAGRRRLLVEMRLFAGVILVGLMLPAWRLTVQDHGYPTVIVIVDETQSMREKDAAIPAAGAVAGGDPAEATAPKTRFDVALHVLLDEDQGLLAELLERRRAKVRLYAIGNGSRLVGEFSPGELDATREAVRQIKATAATSRLGDGLRDVIRATPYRGAATAILLSDFRITEGERLAERTASGEWHSPIAAAAMGRRLPLHLVTLGRLAPPPPLQLHDLQVSDAVYVHDTLVFEARLTAAPLGPGVHEMKATVRLREEGRDAIWAERELTARAGESPLLFQLEHRPTDPGEKRYVVEAEVPGRPGLGVARLERTVQVLATKTVKVLYLEGYPRYEFRALKALLERQIDTGTQTRRVDLKVVLFEADPTAASQDASLLPAMPTAKELEAFDVVIFGDVNPASFKPIDDSLGAIRDFVRIRGGGFLLIAGPRHAPHDYRGTPLAEILPVELFDPATGPGTRHEVPFTPAIPLGRRLHPVFGSGFHAAQTPAEREPLWWHADGYRARPEAEVLAVHPRLASRDAAASIPDRQHPLIVDWQAGAGRSLFLGFDETWAWQALDGAEFYRRFWLQTIRHLARLTPGRVTLVLDSPGPFRRGANLRLIARFPEEYRNVADDERLVVAEYTPPGGGVEVRAYRLQPIAEARGAYELRLENAREGAYQFRLSSPEVSPAPSERCLVLGPPAESEPQFAHPEEVATAAALSGGRAGTAADLTEWLARLPLANDLPRGTVKEHPLWDHPLVWCLLLALLVGEWWLRWQSGVL